ncbi:MAG: M20/M25/M40 family metallo-hydrolase [Candidatus Aenigmatarchaeota archaeon]
MELLKKLMNSFGVSGMEGNVRDLIYQQIRPYVNNIHIDKFGNLIAHKKGKGSKILLAAHMDEIGLMVKKIEEDGRIRCSDIGGFEPIMLVGQRVCINSGKKRIAAVVTTNEVSNNYPTDTFPKIRDLVIDAGLSKSEAVKAGIEIGDYVSMEHNAINLGSEQVISGKALDDRIGCYALIEAAKRMKKSTNEIFYTFTVQEEVGLYGAKMSMYDLEPDFAIVVDVTNANDFYDSPSKHLGDGPTITMKDSAMISNANLVSWIKNTAKEMNIPVQLEVSNFGMTDALSISLSHGGIPSVVVGVAIRNLHTASEVAHMGDIENCVNLLCGLLKKPPKIK